jgi:hypothetical protein
VSSNQDVTPGQLLLAEYQTIKDEQKARIGFRDNLLYVTMAAVAAVAAAAAQTQQNLLLLALPPVCLVLGWTYLVNDEKISAIGRYIRDDLDPRLTALATTEPPGGAGTASTPAFGWETAHRNDPRRFSRKTIQCAVDITAFCLVPLAALVTLWSSGHPSALSTVLSALETIAIAGLAAQFVLYSSPGGVRSVHR